MGEIKKNSHGNVLLPAINLVLWLYHIGKAVRNYHTAYEKRETVMLVLQNTKNKNESTQIWISWVKVYRDEQKNRQKKRQ